MSKPAAKWFDHLPSPRSTPPTMSVGTLHGLLQDRTGSSEVIVVDVRRTDIEESLPGVLPCAINLPAQTFYQTLDTVLPILQRYKHVVFHCGSSQGRGPRCAAWYLDRVKDKGLEENGHILEGGIKAYVAAYPDQLSTL